MDEPYVVIVRMNKWWSGSWKPMVLPLSRDRPKTIWTTDRWGEICHYKKNIRYKIFDCEADARAALPSSVSNAIARMDYLQEQLDKQREKAQAAAVDMVHDWHGSGRK